MVIEIVSLENNPQWGKKELWKREENCAILIVAKSDEANELKSHFFKYEISIFPLGYCHTLCSLMLG